jgi:predicted O-methyltransferase YrrM
MIKLINQLPLPAEHIDKTMFDDIEARDYEHCEMDNIEKRFLHGLIRHFRPKNILEIGVSSGGGSGLILASIEDMEETTLTSIDLSDKAYAFPNESVGFVALRKHKDNNKWNLIPGKDPSEVIEQFGKKFDFAIIDTAHFHPIETLNFLSVLPFLEDGAIVVLHDISLHLSQADYHEMCEFPNLTLATRYLLNSVAAEKLQPEHYQPDRLTQEVNIGAFQVTNDTHKYIEGVFGSLFVQWSLIPDTHILNSVRKIIEKYYSKKYLDMFDRSVRVNYRIQCKELKYVVDLPIILDRYQGKYILFGLRDAESYLNLIRGAGYEEPVEIWDNREMTSNSDSETVIRKPHFDIPDDVAIIFTVRSAGTYWNVTCDWPKQLQERSYFFKKLT